MKQLFQAYLTLGETSDAEGGHHNISAYTDEEHLSGNRKRLSKMSGQYAALKKDPKSGAASQGQVQIDCNPPSTFVAATNATYSYQASSNILRLPVEDEEYIDNLVNIANMSETDSDEVCESFDPLAEAAARIATKISRAITTEIEIASTASIVPVSETTGAAAVDPNAITAELPVLNFEPPASENRSGLSGSFPRLSSGGRKMSHWTSRKTAGVDAWDSRVQSGLTAYEKNSKYTSSYDDLPIVGSEIPEGRSFIEMDKAQDVPSIENYGTGEVKMITSLDNQGAGIRRLSTLRSSMRMIERHDEDELHKPLDPSNSYDAFNSFVSYKSSDSTPKKMAAADEVAAVLSASLDSAATQVEKVSDVVSTAVSETVDSISDELLGCLDELLSECMDAAKAYEDLATQFENTIESNSAVISFAPEHQDASMIEGYAGNFSVTFAESLAVCEKTDVAGHIHEQICFDPKAFAPHTIDGEPIEASCVFDATEKLSFKASENIRTNLESMFNIDPLSLVEETEESTSQEEVEIESVTVVSIEDCELLEVAAVGGKPSRQRTKGTSRSKKNQTRKEKKSKKRAAANA